MITSDSTSAITFIRELFDDEVKTQHYKKHTENKQIAQLARSAEKASNNLMYLATVHTQVHQVVPGCIWTALNNAADTRSRRAAQDQLKAWMPKVSVAVTTLDDQEEEQS